MFGWMWDGTRALGFRGAFILGLLSLVALPGGLSAQGDAVDKTTAAISKKAEVRALLERLTAQIEALEAELSSLRAEYSRAGAREAIAVVPVPAPVAIPTDKKASEKASKDECCPEGISKSVRGDGQAVVILERGPDGAQKPALLHMQLGGDGAGKELRIGGVLEGACEEILKSVPGGMRTTLMKALEGVECEVECLSPGGGKGVATGKAGGDLEICCEVQVELGEGGDDAGGGLSFKISADDLNLDEIGEEIHKALRQALEGLHEGDRAKGAGILKRILEDGDGPLRGGLLMPPGDGHPRMGGRGPGRGPQRFLRHGRGGRGHGDHPMHARLLHRGARGFGLGGGRAAGASCCCCCEGKASKGGRTAHSGDRQGRGLFFFGPEGAGGASTRKGKPEGAIEIEIRVKDGKGEVIRKRVIRGGSSAPDPTTSVEIEVEAEAETAASSVETSTR
ncbi:MAG: hypothetical protein ACE5GW_04340 [Planctomycetota bacterium]